MANTFPQLSSGSMTVHSDISSNAMTMYPTRLNFSYSTRVLRFATAEEQRWTVRGQLFAATLTYHNLNGFDLSLLYNFFIAMRGAYVDTAYLNVFSLTLSGETYDYCVFDQDQFLPQVERPEFYSLELRVRQLRPN